MIFLYTNAIITLIFLVVMVIKEGMGWSGYRFKLKIEDIYMWMFLSLFWFILIPMALFEATRDTEIKIKK